MRAALAPLLALALLAGCLAPSDDAPSAEDRGRRETSDAAIEDLVIEVDGELTGTPATPDAAEFPFDVPKGAVGVAATLTWSDPTVNALRVELLDPRGEPAGSGFPEKAGQASVATLEPPASGAWTARVFTERAIGAAFALTIRVSFLVPGENALEDTVDLPPGDFAEINLIMEEGATFNVTFTATGGTVSWNVHSHENGETTNHDEGEGAAEGDVSFTAPKRQIYSILFQADATPVTLSYAIEGAFRVHSHSQ